MKPGRGAGDQDLPDVSATPARILVLSLGSFWVLAGTSAFAIESSLALPIFVAAFASGMLFYATLFRVWDRPMIVWPGPGYFERSRQGFPVMLSLFRPKFIGRVFRATGWPPAIVAILLVVLLVGAVTATITMQPRDDTWCTSNC